MQDRQYNSPRQQTALSPGVPRMSQNWNSGDEGGQRSGFPPGNWLVEVVLSCNTITCTHTQSVWCIRSYLVTANICTFGTLAVSNFFFSRCYSEDLQLLGMVRAIYNTHSLISSSHMCNTISSDSLIIILIKCLKNSTKVYKKWKLQRNKITI